MKRFIWYDTCDTVILVCMGQICIYFYWFCFFVCVCVCVCPSLHACARLWLLTDLEEERHDKEKLNPLSPMTTAQVMRQTGFKASNKAPQKVLFIDHLTRTLCEYLPDLWRLGQSYFSGKLLKEVWCPSFYGWIVYNGSLLTWM